MRRRTGRRDRGSGGCCAWIPPCRKSGTSADSRMEVQDRGPRTAGYRTCIDSMCATRLAMVTTARCRRRLRLAVRPGCRDLDCPRRSYAFQRRDDFLRRGRAALRRRLHDVVDRQDALEVAVLVQHRQAPHVALCHGGQRDLSPLHAPRAWRAPDYGMIVSQSSTCVTPGAAHAARSASCRSNHECTLPVGMTFPSSAVTLTRRALISALRLNAASVLSCTSIDLETRRPPTSRIAPVIRRTR